MRRPSALPDSAPAPLAPVPDRGSASSAAQERAAQERTSATLAAGRIMAAPDASVIAAPRRISLAVQVTRDLQAQIDDGRLRPGDQLPTERELCVRYGVSRTVVREAVSSLRASGRLAVEQGRGAFILSPAQATPRYHLQPSEAGAVEDVLNLMEVRIALESEAASLAAQRAGREGRNRLAAVTRQLGESAGDPGASAALDQAFHLCIAALSGNNYFGTLLGGLSPQLVPRARLDLFKDDAAARADYLRKLQLEHTHILDAVLRADAEGARAAMRLHLSNSRERLRSALSEIGATSG